MHDPASKRIPKPRKHQGYNARLDESLGAKAKGRKSKQSFKARRAESKGARKPRGSYGFGKR
jgi:hypothetical protein